MKNSIYKVSEINLIDSAINHLNSVESLYLKEIEKSNKNSKAIEAYKDQNIILKDKIENDEKTIKIYNSNIAVNEEKIKNLDDIIKTTASSRELLDTLSLLNQNLNDTENRIIILEDDKLEIFQNNYHRLLLKNEFNNYAAELELAAKENRIPPPIKSEVTARILRTETCICGRHIGDEEKKYIIQINSENEDKEELSYLTAGIYANESVNKDLKDAVYSFKDCFNNLANENDAKKILQQKIHEINESLDTAQLDIHDNPEARRNDLRNEININISAKSSASNRIEAHSRLLRDNLDLLKKVIAKDHATNELENKRLTVLKLVDYLDDVKADMEETIRKKMQKSVSEIFFNVMPDTVFKHLTIDENYIITLSSPDGVTYTTDQLSTGQAKVLGLSLAYSLSKDVGYESSPMLIDNLYGDIKDTRFEELTKIVEILANKKQVFIMDLNAEKSRSMFKDNLIVQEFDIDRIESEMKTVIKEIGK